MRRRRVDADETGVERFQNVAIMIGEKVRGIATDAERQPLPVVQACVEPEGPA